MRRPLFSLSCVFCFVIASSALSAGVKRSVGVEAISPDGQLRIELLIADVESDPRTSPTTYRVFFRERPIILPSRLAIDVSNGASLGLDSVMEGVQRRTIRETYTQRPGKRSRVVNHCEEVVVSLRERAAPSRRWEIILRAYDDGVAPALPHSGSTGCEGTHHPR